MSPGRVIFVCIHCTYPICVETRVRFRILSINSSRVPLLALTSFNVFPESDFCPNCHLSTCFALLPSIEHGDSIHAVRCKSPAKFLSLILTLQRQCFACLARCPRLADWYQQSVVPVMSLVRRRKFATSSSTRARTTTSPSQATLLPNRHTLPRLLVLAITLLAIPI